MIHSINPATEVVLKSFDLHTSEIVDTQLAKARSAQKKWGLLALSKRTALLRRMAELLRTGKTDYATLITQEMGKPLTEAMSEVEKCAWNCEYYADHAQTHLGDEVLASNATLSKIVYDPLGLVLAVMPWNYPFWQVMRFAAPALAAGNGIVLKHANNVPQCALALEALLARAARDVGAPQGLLVTVLVDNSSVQSLIEDPRIAAVTLTGSTPVGKLVAAQAGGVLKKQVLELGGSDAFIVLADADIELAAKTGVKARFQNVGQSCIAAKRFIVVDSVADQFVERFCHHAAQLQTGDPMLPENTMGAMARGNLRDELHAQVQKTVAQGAKLIIGGKFADQVNGGKGFFYEPTVLDHVKPSMTAGCEETFGPVAAIMRVPDTASAIALANSLDYGLGAALWTRDTQTAEILARSIEAGAVFINGLVASDPRYPFGGIKQSGYGRELGSHGAREFTNIKTVWVGPSI